MHNLLDHAHVLLMLRLKNLQVSVECVCLEAKYALSLMSAKNHTHQPYRRVFRGIADKVSHIMMNHRISCRSSSNTSVPSIVSRKKNDRIWNN